MYTGPGFAKPSRDRFSRTVFRGGDSWLSGPHRAKRLATTGPAITLEAPAVTGPLGGPLAGYAFTFLYMFA